MDLVAPAFGTGQILDSTAAEDQFFKGLTAIVALKFKDWHNISGSSPNKIYFKTALTVLRVI